MKILLLSLWVLGLTSCQENRSARPGKPANQLNAEPLDRLVKAFLLHAHDSVTTDSDSLVSQLTRALQAQGIDTILYFRTGCSGCDILVEPGEPACVCSTMEQSSCLFWQQQRRTFSKKLDCCRNYPVAPAPAQAFTFYLQNRAVFARGETFYADFNTYNQAHPQTPRFLPSGPVHDLDVSEILLRTGTNRYHATVWGGTYDAAGNPLFMKYDWRRKQWQ